MHTADSPPGWRDGWRGGWDYAEWVLGLGLWPGQGLFVYMQETLGPRGRSVAQLGSGVVGWADDWGWKVWLAEGPLRLGAT